MSNIIFFQKKFDKEIFILIFLFK